jgi:hypothetical protein
VTTPDWKPVLAALGNEAARTVFAYAALGRLDPAARGELNSRERRAVQAWLGLGVLVEDDDGSVSVDGAVLRATLASPGSEGSGKARSGVGRFLDGPRIIGMPASPAERTELLRWVRDRALEPGEVLTEAELNQRLRVFHPDVAMIRRYLVDESLLERTPSGTEYAIPED